MALTKLISKASSVFFRPSYNLARAGFSTSAIVRSSKNDKEDFDGKWLEFLNHAGVKNQEEDYVQKLVSQKVDLDELLQFEDDVIQRSLEKYLRYGDVLKCLLYVKKIKTKAAAAAAASGERRRIECSRPDRSLNNRFTGIIKLSHFVDKTLFIDEFIRSLFGESGESFPLIENEVIVDPVLFIAPRGFGKTTILHMLDAFFSGCIPDDKLKTLKIFKSEQAMKWYGKVVVIHLSFGLAREAIRSKDDAITACREIIRAAYKDYSYIISSLCKTDAKEFNSWLDNDECKKKDVGEIARAIKFLIDCVILHHKFKKKCILLVDEFDRLSSRAMFHCDSGTLHEIVDLYSDMIGIPLKHGSGADWCYGIFTGVTSITAYTTSSLNNLTIIPILNNETFFKFYGFTLEEFKDVLENQHIPDEVKKWKDYAKQFYNGYRMGSISLLNSYSVKQFIESKAEPKAFWKESGAAVGLSRALRFCEWRKVVMKLMTGGSVQMKYMESINVSEFENIGNPCFELINYNTMLNLLFQQGYLCITTAENDVVSAEPGQIVCVKCPNLEVQLELGKQLEISFACTFNFNQISLRECAIQFLKMNLSDDESCKVALKNVKTLLNTMLSTKKKQEVNESWFEKFLYHIFVEHFIIKTQEKIPETVQKNEDLRSVRIYDMYIEADGKCFIFEESTKDNTEETLKRMIEKNYYTPAKNTGLPFLLIACSLKADHRGYAHIDIRFLRNKTEGEGIEV